MRRAARIALAVGISLPALLGAGVGWIYRSWARATFTGIPLDDLGRLLEAHGARAEVHHASETELDAFRAMALKNLETPGDFVLVNYLRDAVAQGTGGHISPLGAYDAESDRFLVMDVAAHKYPPVWMEAALLHASMLTVDKDGGTSRGFVLVSR